VSDGAFQTACQQTCATQAITFGDLNDPQSRVAKMKDSPHAYRVLEILNNQPAISYMTKVRNKASEAHSS
jgi:molybdopterin-containing oxidoreductase family iron-sulfur binding subunit